METECGLEECKKCTLNQPKSLYILFIKIVIFVFGSGYCIATLIFLYRHFSIRSKPKDEKKAMEEMEMTKGNSTSTIRKLNYANSDLEMKNGSGSGMTGGD